MRQTAMQDAAIAVSAIEKLNLEYLTFVQNSKTICLSDLVGIGNSCLGFIPNPNADVVRADAERFGEKYSTWLSKSKYFIDCAFFLFPKADKDRLLTITRNLSIGFYLNDQMGRDVFKLLSPEQQVESAQLIERMAILRPGIPPHPLEMANIEVLNEFKANSPAGWYETFVRVYNYHISLTHKDWNTATLGYVPSVETYVENRLFFAGVHHVLLWVEYSSGLFLNQKDGPAYRLIGLLHQGIKQYAALLNDLFSFEYEVIDNRSDSNYVVILAINEGLGFEKAISKSAYNVRKILMEIRQLIKEIDSSEHLHPDFRTHTDHLKCLLQGIWVWHAGSVRYKRQNSMWTETQIRAGKLKGAA